MMTIWRRCSIATGVVLMTAAFLLPLTSSAGAVIGPVATTTTVVNYRCVGVGFAALLNPVADQNVTLTLGAPTEVSVGQVYTLTVDVTPLTLKPPAVPISTPAFISMNPVGATGSDLGRARSANVPFVGAVANVPRSLMTVTPTAAAGGQVVLTATRIRIVQGSTGFECDPVAAATPATITTRIIAQPTTTTTTTTPTTTSSTTPGQTTTSTTTTSTSTTTTVPVTAPPPTTTPTTTSTTRPPVTSPPATTPPTTPPTIAPPSTPAGAAVSVRSSATASFTCNIFDSSGTKFNQNPLPPSNVTITITAPDKVGVGGSVSGLIKFDPGPANGPIKLNAGTVNFAATLAIGGGSPASVQATGGPNSVEIPANGTSRSPEMSFSFAASAPAGSEIQLGVSQVEVRASSPAVLITRCTPTGNAMNRVAGIAVVEGTVAAPAELTAEVQSVGAANSSASAAAAAQAEDGFANCDEARAAGRGTIVSTDPAYKASLDSDNDGLACEKGEGVGSLASTGTSSGLTLAWSAVLLALGAVFVQMGRRRAR